MKKIQLLLMASLFLFACKSDTTKEITTTTKTKENTTECYFTVNKEDIKFKWTAFKTTSRIGVHGTFDEITFTNDKKDTQITNLILNTEFKINLSSVNSENKTRDGKLIKFFFGKLFDSEVFYGRIKDVEGNNFKGIAHVALKMNNFEDIVRMEYTLDNNILNLQGDLDLLNWKTTESLKALGNACKELHKGEDGVSKTWSEMHIEVNVPLTIDCK